MIDLAVLPRRDAHQHNWHAPRLDPEPGSAVIPGAVPVEPAPDPVPAIDEKDFL